MKESRNNAGRIFLASLITLTVWSVSQAKAQGGMTATDQDATLTVRLNEAIGLEVLKTATMLEFSTAADYQNGVNKTEASALRVTSTRAYELKVKSRDASLTHSGGSTIAVGNVNVETPTVLTSNNQVALSISDQTVATGAPAIKKEIDLKYSTSAANSAFVGKPEGDYTAALVYSVVTL
jgi:hypothetical protein